MSIHIYTREIFSDTMKAGQRKTFIFMTVEVLKKFFDFFVAAQGNMASAEKNGLRLSTVWHDHAG
jgi:hypothetical protein